jgi:hypothetical protein
MIDASNSVIGTLNYLANNIHPDISMAVHQCARFCSRPKALHELTIKCIAHYLLATKDKGLVLTPNKSFVLEIFVDADFADHWHKEFSHLQDSLLSRMFFLVTFWGCPISWSSKLQSKITSSMAKSKYIALSSDTREILPLRHVLQDILDHIFVQIPSSPSDSIVTKNFQSTISAPKVFEDNTACFVLTTTETTFKPWTKHISLKYHHFHDQIRNGLLKIVIVDTHSNWADMFTKPLGCVKYEHLCKLLMGWLAHHHCSLQLHHTGEVARAFSQIGYDSISIHSILIYK